MTNCSAVTVLLVSTRPIGIIEQLPQQVKHIFLNSLKPQQAVESFIDQSNDIYEDEILELILANPKGCINKILPNVQDLEEPVSEEIKSRILFALRDYNNRLEVLAAHDMFQQISGNPMSIRILANFHRSDFYQASSLAQIYKRMMD